MIQTRIARAAERQRPVQFTWRLRSNRIGSDRGKPGLNHQIQHWKRNTSGADEVSPPTGFCSIFVPAVEPDFHGLWMRTIISIISGTRVLLPNRGKRAVVQLDVLVVKGTIDSSSGETRHNRSSQVAIERVIHGEGSVMHDTRHGSLLNVWRSRQADIPSLLLELSPKMRETKKYNPNENSETPRFTKLCLVRSRDILEPGNIGGQLPSDIEPVPDTTSQLGIEPMHPTPPL